MLTSFCSVSISYNKTDWNNPFDSSRILLLPLRSRQTMLHTHAFHPVCQRSDCTQHSISGLPLSYSMNIETRNLVSLPGRTWSPRFHQLSFRNRAQCGQVWSSIRASFSLRNTGQSALVCPSTCSNWPSHNQRTCICDSKNCRIAYPMDSIHLCLVSDSRQSLLHRHKHQQICRLMRRPEVRLTRWWRLSFYGKIKIKTVRIKCFLSFSSS